MTTWGATTADFQDAETLANAAGVPRPDRFSLRFRYRRAGGDWSEPLYVRARHKDGRPARGSEATERMWEAGLATLEAAQLRQLGFLSAVLEAGIPRSAVEVELVDNAKVTLLEEWSRAAAQ